MNDRSGLELGERLVLEAALDDAFATLRDLRCRLSPTRVRAAVRWGRGAERERVRWAAPLARLSELSAAAGVAAMIFVGAFGTAEPGGPVSMATMREDVTWVRQAQLAGMYVSLPTPQPSEDADFLRWLRLDRYVPIQDWLDPTVVRPKAAPVLRAPAPSGSETAGPF